jgi:hypothetical protein
VARPRYSFVRAALERCRSAAAVLRLTLGAWWNGDVRIGRRIRDPARSVAHPFRGCTPQPLSVFPELQRLIVHEAAFADPAVRAQRVWEEVGEGDALYAYFIVSNVRGRTVGMLMRNHDPAYVRLYLHYTFAAVDSAFWAREIRFRPVRHAFALGGIDHLRHCTWSVIVVQRDRRCELQITTGSLIPWTRDFKSVEEATRKAEAWLTDFHHQGDDDGGGGDHSGNEGKTAWFM